MEILSREWSLRRDREKIQQKFDSNENVGRSSRILRVHMRSGTLGTERVHGVLIDELHSGGVSCYYHTHYDVAEWMCIFG